MTRNMKWWGWGAEGKEANLSNMPKFLPYVEDLLGCDTTQKQAIIALDDITLPSVIENNDFFQQTNYSRIKKLDLFIRTAKVIVI